MRSIRFLGIVGFFGLFGFFTLPSTASANLPPLTFRYKHHLFSIDPDRYPAWNSARDVWVYAEKDISLPQRYRVDGDTLPPLPSGVTRESRTGWDPSAIEATIRQTIAAKLDRAPGVVTIARNGSGEIIFNGVGMIGRNVDTETASVLAIAALERGMTDVVLPVRETQPQITVDDPTLREQGIREVVTIGESDFTGSPVNRQHNIRVGLSKFNGTLIPRGSVFSFNTVLGRVDGSTGYRRELVIKGDRTEPDYGGGLCQVSTTAYRGVWEYGFPIEKRINHSYAVSYYFPQGTDATVYPPNPDMKFRNDGPGDLLIQTHVGGTKAYFIYYGTRDARRSDVLGPFIWGTRAPPPDRTVYTTELPVGTKKKLGERHAGLSAAWYRFRTTSTGALLREPVYSVYEARPLFYEVGVESLPEESGNSEGPAITTDELNASELPRDF